jgi:hypothetical protein
MTPSGWGDDAQSRDAGHDEMQAHEFRGMLKMIDSKQFVINRPRNGYVAESVPFVASYAEVEWPFEAAGRLIGFADIAVQFLEVDSEKTTQSPRSDWWFYLEIKPRIYSVGAVIRQCKATAINAARSVPVNHRGTTQRDRFEVWAVVYQDDPKALLLQELYPYVLPQKREVALEAAP